MEWIYEKNCWRLMVEEGDCTYEIARVNSPNKYGKCSWMADAPGHKGNGYCDSINGSKVMAGRAIRDRLVDLVSGGKDAEALLNKLLSVRGVKL